LETYTKLNSAPITGRTHTDTGLAAAAAGVTYYYALSAVDSSSDESVKSAPAAVTISASNSSSGGGGEVPGALSLLPVGTSRRTCSSRWVPWRCYVV
jgi:hypothetical protein